MLALNPNRLVNTRLILPLLILIVLAAPLVRLAQQEVLGTQTRQGEMVTFLDALPGGYAPTISRMVTADGRVSVSVPTDVGMPAPPNCNDLGLTSECDWEMDWTKDPANGRFDHIEVRLTTEDGNVVSRVQLMEVETTEFDQLTVAHNAGHSRGWIAHVQVARRFMQNGVGRLTWQAGDAALKIWAGANGADTVMRIVCDTAGWGTSLMRHVPPEAFVFSEDSIWIYLVTRG